MFEDKKNTQLITTTVIYVRFLLLRYETLAVASDAETRQDANMPLKSGGKRLMVSPRDTGRCSCVTTLL